MVAEAGREAGYPLPRVPQRRRGGPDALAGQARAREDRRHLHVRRAAGLEARQGGALRPAAAPQGRLREAGRDAGARCERSGGRDRPPHLGARGGRRRPRRWLPRGARRHDLRPDEGDLDRGARELQPQLPLHSGGRGRAREARARERGRDGRDRPRGAARSGRPRRERRRRGRDHAVLVAERAGARPRGRLPRVPRRQARAPGAGVELPADQPGGRRVAPAHCRRGRQPRLPERAERAAGGHDRASRADERARARVHARLDRRELQGPTGQLPPGRHGLPHLLRLLGAGSPDRPRRPAGDELVAGARAEGASALQLPARHRPAPDPHRAGAARAVDRPDRRAARPSSTTSRSPSTWTPSS